MSDLLLVVAVDKTGRLIADRLVDNGHPVRRQRGRTRGHQDGQEAEKLGDLATSVEHREYS